MKLDTPNKHSTKQRAIEAEFRILLFKGIKWYQLYNDLTWPQIAAQMKEKGVNFGLRGLYNIDNNWSATNFRFFYILYDTLGIPTPTPELLLYWDQEIKRMEAERAEARRVKREKVQAGKLREAERIAAGGTPRKHNDKRK